MTEVLVEILAEIKRGNELTELLIHALMQPEQAQESPTQVMTQEGLMDVR